ncbi:amidohydrolase family protein [Pseudonocardia pini]|uniref:amidohydrolase family protein n=1 Tax=Pseudonocardia pini TaxID=2758030 RepID=UPI0015F10330|nr:amidohydrolase family protein [Pseudonocardia pini]
MRTLVTDAVVVPVDGRVDHLPAHDVLVEDGVIRAIVPTGTREHPGAEVIDGRGCAVLPGLVNTHLHSWQTLLRGTGADWVTDDYFTRVHAGLARRLVPEDNLDSTLLGMWGQLDAGTTTVFDWCHDNRTPAFSDHSVAALRESGVRAVFGHGTVKPPPRPGEPHFSRVPHPRGEATRLRAELADDSALVTLALCILGPDYSTLEVTRADLALAAELDLPTSAHVWGTANRLVADGYRVLEKEGLLSARHNLAHGNFLGDEELAVLTGAGVSVTATPAAEIQGTPRRPLLERVMRAGGTPALGTDSEITTSASMLETIRRSLDVERHHAVLELDRLAEAGTDPALNARIAASLEGIANAGGSLNERVSVTAMQALEWATINGARALGMADRIGSLEPGKRADLILVRLDDPNIAPATDPVGAVVTHAHSGNVDTVLVDGRVVKRDGRLLVRDRAREVGARLAERAAALAAEPG